MSLPSRLPAWDQLLASLHALPQGKLDSQALRFELLLLVADQSIDFDQLLARLCVLLPKIGHYELAGFFTRAGQHHQVLHANIAAKQLKVVQASHAVEQALQTRRLSRLRLAKPINLPNRSLPLRHIITVNLGLAPSGSLILLIGSSSAPASMEVEFIQLIGEVLKLRAGKLLLTSQLNQEIARFTTLTHHLGEGLIILDKQFRVVLWNQALEKLTGFTANSAIGHHYSQALRRADAVDWVKASLEDGSGRSPAGVYFTDFEILTKSNKKKWVNISSSVMRTARGDLDQVIILVRDISHFKELELRKNEFISIATHELRTPITAVLGYLSLMAKNKSNFTEKQELYLIRASQAISRLVRLAEDLLRVVQVEEDRLMLTLAPLNPYPIMRKVVRDFTPRSKQKGLELILSKPTFITKISVDSEKFEQVLANLVDNAIKYTPKGKVEVSCRLVTSRTGKEFVQISVQDTGIGIQARQLDKIFEKFQRSHDPQHVRELGAGLGLFIVKSFVMKQGGQITVKSRPGRGTLFTVTFPAIKKNIRSKT